MLNRIEYGERGKTLSKKLWLQSKSQPDKKQKDEVKNFLDGEFQTVMQDFSLNLKEIHFEADKSQLMRIFFQVRDLRRKDTLYNVWAGIPSK